ncbi:MAG: hypothetical protein KC713_08780, partial [Candidatus Omnitrophica bacterium]|nr:hypothetical protein [Candidatus Omnitrophota bacterium]
MNISRCIKNKDNHYNCRELDAGYKYPGIVTVLFCVFLIFTPCQEVGSKDLEVGVFRSIKDEDMLFQHQPKHIIFLIHGIGGNRKHFGFTGKALHKILNAKDPHTKYIIKPIEYDTGNNDKTPYDFARDIDLTIKRYTAQADFKAEDKFSMIMHSQGGLVGSIWIFQSMLSSPGYSTPETIKHLDAFITLGTPFWGAKTAQWGHDIKLLTQKLGVEVPLPFGRRELEQMSFGSDMIYDFRRAVIDEQYKGFILQLEEQVRFLNVVGVADIMNPLGIFVSGSEKYEDDGAVPISSARFNFLYHEALDPDYLPGSVSNLENTSLVDIHAPYVVVNAMHRSPLPELE